jgi:Zn ribbon nucleic-acid-binding protein
MSESKMLLAVHLKKCSRCKAIKSVTLYSKNRTNHDGLQNECLACNHIRRKLKAMEREE